MILKTLLNRCKWNWISLCPWVSAIFLFYVGFSSHPIIVHDSIDYEQLGIMFTKFDWLSYFKTGPNREPLYPLFIALAMTIAKPLQIPYTVVLLCLQIIALLISQLLLIHILRTLKVSHKIIVIIAFYFVLSPNILNSSLVVFSEILIYPLILIYIFMLYDTILEIIHKDIIFKNLIIRSVLLSLIGILLCFNKSFFEFIIPSLFLALLPIIIRQSNSQKPRQKIVKNYLILSAMCCCLFFLSIIPFKMLNKTYNNTFALTNRGPWAVYGNIVRCSDGITWPKFFSAVLTIIPDKGFCNSIFKDCGYWDCMPSDRIGINKFSELISINQSPDQTNRQLTQLSIQRFLQYPIESIALSFVQASRFFFWEFFSPSFVAIPNWIENIYNWKPLYYLLLFAVPLASILAFISAFRSNLLIANILSVFILLFIIGHSFVFTSERYALQLAPLFLILIGLTMHQWLSKNNRI